MINKERTREIKSNDGDLCVARRYVQVFCRVSEKNVKEVRRMVEVDIHVRGLEEAAAQSGTHLAQSLSLFNSTTQSLSFYLEPAGGTMMYTKVLYNLYTTKTAAPGSSLYTP